MKSQLFGKVAEKSEAAAEAARQSLTLPDINAKGTVGKALPPKAKPKGPDAAELAQLQREEEARKKAEQERMRKEHIEKTESAGSGLIHSRLLLWGLDLTFNRF